MPAAFRPEELIKGNFTRNDNGTDLTSLIDEEQSISKLLFGLTTLVGVAFFLILVVILGLSFWFFCRKATQTERERTSNAGFKVELLLSESEMEDLKKTCEKEAAKKLHHQKTKDES